MCYAKIISLAEKHLPPLSFEFSLINKEDEDGMHNFLFFILNLVPLMLVVCADYL